ncbi:Cutinase [Mycena kentingensis (nom. inval.)]|nr:Cutinase [Mycena kentingensis (nom. inval.)]
MFLLVLALSGIGLAYPNAHVRDFPMHDLAAHSRPLNTERGLLDGIGALLGNVLEGVESLGDVVLEVGEILSGVKTGEGDYGGSGCADIMVIFARGTTESGTIGSTVGPAFVKSMLKAVDTFPAAHGMNLSFKGVPYPASFPGYFEGGSPQGSATMAYMLKEVASKCPNSAIVSTGYSQGGQLVHNSAQILAHEAPNVLLHIKAVVIFGDPDADQPMPDQIPPYTVKIFCHSRDAVCRSARDDGTWGTVPKIGLLLAAPFIGLTLPEHLNYEKETDYAAQFVVETVTRRG